jgi:hypothetical protein
MITMDEKYTKLFKDKSNEKANKSFSLKIEKQLNKFRSNIGPLKEDIKEEFCVSSNKYKVRYSSSSEAYKAIKRYEKEVWSEDDKPKSVYYCNTCECWHTTSSD